MDNSTQIVFARPSNCNATFPTPSSHPWQFYQADLAPKLFETLALQQIALICWAPSETLGPWQDRPDISVKVGLVELVPHPTRNFFPQVDHLEADKVKGGEGGEGKKKEESGNF